MSAMPRRRRVFRISEKQHQANGVAVLKTINAQVQVFGTRRSRGRRCPKCGEFVPEDQGTRQTPGSPDVYALLPPVRLVTGVVLRLPLWWEVKAEDGVRSPEQVHFATIHEATVAAGFMGYCCGTFDVLIGWLVAHAYLKAQNVPHYYLRPDPVALSSRGSRS